MLSIARVAAHGASGTGLTDTAETVGLPCCLELAYVLVLIYSSYIQLIFPYLVAAGGKEDRKFAFSLITFFPKPEVESSNYLTISL